jgi:Dolichyl-phosphate-mannose-protein mannosyltransferase
VAKVAGGVFIGNSLNIQALGTFWSDPNRVYSWAQNNAFLKNPGVMGNWPLTFLGWDSAWYLNIMTKGYEFSAQSYTFSPAFPFFAKLANLVLQSPMGSLALTALVFGVLWIPLYQLLAEGYIGKKAALLSALLLAFSPYLFVFTTVSYSEGTLLFFALGAWLLLKKGKMFGASVFAAVAPLTRIMGILMVLPILYASFKQKTYRVRNTLLSLLPVASLTVWFAGLGFSTGDFFAPVHTSEWAQLYSFRTLLTEGISRYGIKAILEAPYQPSPIPTHWLLPIAVVSALIFPLLLFHGTWKIDKSLWIYSVAGYAGILCFGALVSTPRFVSVLFPLWIPLTACFSGSKKSIVIAVIIAVSFYIVALDLWISFLNGQFVA